MSASRTFAAHMGDEPTQLHDANEALIAHGTTSSHEPTAGPSVTFNHDPVVGRTESPGTVWKYSPAVSRRQSNSTNGSELPFPPNRTFFYMPWTGRCPTCWHRYRSAKVKVPTDRAQFRGVLCSRCKSKMMGFGGGRNETHWSLISSESLPPHDSRVQKKKTLRANLAGILARTVGSALGSVPEAAASPNSSIYHGALGTSQDTPVDGPHGSQPSPSQAPIQHSADTNPRHSLDAMHQQFAQNHSKPHRLMGWLKEAFKDRKGLLRKLKQRMVLGKRRPADDPALPPQSSYELGRHIGHIQRTASHNAFGLPGETEESRPFSSDGPILRPIDEIPPVGNEEDRARWMRRAITVMDYATCGTNCPCPVHQNPPSSAHSNRSEVRNMVPDSILRVNGQEEPYSVFNPRQNQTDQFVAHVGGAFSHLPPDRISIDSTTFSGETATPSIESGRAAPATVHGPRMVLLAHSGAAITGPRAQSPSLSLRGNRTTHPRGTSTARRRGSEPALNSPGLARRQSTLESNSGESGISALTLRRDRASIQEHPGRSTTPLTNGRPTDEEREHLARRASQGVSEFRAQSLGL